MTHVPAGRDGRRPTARSKGKVERPFRTVKEAHETLYHFHKPETEAEANAWLARFISRYNAQPHRREPHSRIEDWMRNLPSQGFARCVPGSGSAHSPREPERRNVAGDARIRVEGAFYDVEPDLAGETVTVWWGTVRSGTLRRIPGSAVRTVFPQRGSHPVASVSQAPPLRDPAPRRPDRRAGPQDISAEDGVERGA